MKKYKGLIIGRNPVNLTTGNGKTVATYFQKFDPDCLANLYVTNLPIDKSICSYYYRIDERDILPFPTKHSHTGKIEQNVVEERGGIDYESKMHKWVKSILNGKLWLLIRSFFWKREKWLKDSLMEWIHEFQPDFIFYDGGNLPYEYEKIAEIKDQMNLPLIVYISDDYILAEKGLGFCNLYKKKMVRAFEKLAEKADLCIMISEAMKHKFQSYVPCKIHVAMNGSDSEIEYEPYKRSTEKIKIVYAGNVGIGRWDILKKVNQAAQILNSEGYDIQIDIFSSFSVSAKNKKEMEESGITHFCGAVYGEELQTVRKKADILLHVESFKRRYQTILSTALSTKIPEYLLLGRPILVVAPDYAESGNFIRRNRFGIVVNSISPKEIAGAIRKMLSHSSQMQAMAERAHYYSERKMSRAYVSNMIYEDIHEICAKYWGGKES